MHGKWKVRMLSRFIAEATECDFKQALETRKPKSWLKSVSAFANTNGGTLFFGVDNKHDVVGLHDPQQDAEDISRLIKERISPVPRFILSPERENGKVILLLSIPKGTNTPYYYKADGVREAYIRIGDESIIAPDHMLHELILDGMNKSYDSLTSKYDAADFAFTKLRERYRIWTGKSFDNSYLESFGLVDENGKLTNAGALFADECPLRHSRLFCVRWNGLTKAGGLIDAIDSAEYNGSLITLLIEGAAFIRRNMRLMWKKTSTSRIEMPDYAERSYFEAITNALIHRNYLVLGSEVHIDIFDDRLEITSPGGMINGKNIQDLDLRKSIISERRNPILADVFSRIGYMERQGSGIRKIIEGYETEPNYSDDMKPEFTSDSSQFCVTLKNLNYGKSIREINCEYPKSGGLEENPVVDEPKSGGLEENPVVDEPKSGGSDDNPMYIDPETDIINIRIDDLPFNSQTKKNIEKMLLHFGDHTSFSRKDIKSLCGIGESSAGDLLLKLKSSCLIEPIEGQGKGKYKFKR